MMIYLRTLIVWSVFVFCSTATDSVVLNAQEHHPNETQPFQIVDFTKGALTVTFSPDGRFVVSGGEDEEGRGIIKVWDVANENIVQAIPFDGTSPSQIVVSPDGHMMASIVGNTPTIWVWETTTWRLIRTIMTAHPVMSISFSPATNELASASNVIPQTGEGIDVPLVEGDAQGILQLWNVHTGQVTLTAQDSQHGMLSIMFSPDGKRIATVGKHGVNMWNAKTGAFLNTISPSEEGTTLLDVVFSKDGSFLVGSGDNGTLYVWDGQTHQEIRTMHVKAAGTYLFEVALSPDSAVVASCACPLPEGSGGFGIVLGLAMSTIDLWDVSTGQHLGQPAGQCFPFMQSALQFSPDGRLLGIAQSTGTELWEVKSLLAK